MKQIQLIIFLLCFNNFFGQEKPILIVDNDKVFKSEFEQIYWKNKKEKVATKEDLNEYIKLFVNFKLKVKAAEAIGLDTTKKFKDELSGYRYQLEKPYLIDTSINEDLINEAYYRTVNEINASHIMVKLGPNPTPDFRNNIALSWPSSIDDSIARKDWLWSHEFNLEKTVEKMLFGITTL